MYSWLQRCISYTQELFYNQHNTKINADEKLQHYEQNRIFAYSWIKKDKTDYHVGTFETIYSRIG